MGIFDNVHETKTYDNVPSLKLGSYRLRLEKLEVGNTQRQQKEFVRATVTVLKSRGEDASEEGSIAEIFITPHPMYPDYAKKDIANMTKAFIGAPLTKEAWTEVKENAEALKGEEADVDVVAATDKKTGAQKFRKNGDLITEMRWMTGGIVPAAIPAASTGAAGKSVSKRG